MLRFIFFFFCMSVSNHSSIICWKDCLFSFVASLLLCQRLVDCIYMGLFLGSLFWSINLFDYLVLRVYFFFQIFHISDHVIQEQIQLYVFLPSLYTFYFFFLSIALSRVSTMMLKSRGGREHLCLIPDLRRKAFIFFHFLRWY